MCGRFFFVSDAASVRADVPYATVPETLPARYNMAPGQPVPVIIHTDAPQMAFFRWGLVPGWAKDPGIGNRLINARVETVAAKPSFRNALARRRCLMPANGFYEWAQAPGDTRKTPLAFRRRDSGLLLFAGLWEVWQPAEGTPLYTGTILTAAATGLIARFHTRMPVILTPEAGRRWIDPAEPEPLALLTPYPVERLMAYPVSPLVNNPRIDAPACLEAQGKILETEEVQLRLPGSSWAA